MSLEEAVKVFILATSIDVLAVFWVLGVAGKNWFSAAIISMIMGLISTEGYFEIIDNRNLRFVYVVGLGFGTVLGLVLKKMFDELRRKDP